MVLKGRNIGVGGMERRINGVLGKKVVVEEEVVGIREIEVKREGKKDVLCIMVDNVECYELG